jgi:hypothetical protein
MNKSIAALIFATFATIMLTETHLMAQVILPIGLSPGTQYQLIFVTKDFWSTPTDGNIADYNAFVTTEANQSSQLAALGVQWNAIVSTTTENARSHLINGAGE